MTSHNAGTPVSLPKIAKSVKLDVPSTPPAAKAKKRLLAFLATPEQPGDQLPFSPGLKRDSSGLLKSPDYKLNSNDANLLKTPKNGGYESDDKDTPRRLKMLRTPQFFSPGKRLFNDDQSPNKEELAEISSQLKSRLSTALGKVKGHDKSQIAPTKLDFLDQSFTTTRELPTKMLKMSPRLQSTPLLVQRANLNLQTLQALPVPPSSQSHERLQQLPDFKRDRVRIPSPEADASAQSALQAAFSRLKEKRRSFSISERRRSSHLGLEGSPQKDKEAPRLPPINVGFNNKHSPPQDSEQDAVFSLMLLSSPQKLVDSRGHSRQQSQNTNSTHTLRSSLVVNTVLPPISGIMKNVDNDETDIEETTMSEGESSS